MIAVAVHLGVIVVALTVLARELARELVYLRVAYAGLRTTRPWHGTVLARPACLRARAADAGATPPVRWPHHVAVELSTGFRIYRLRPGDRWQTREEVEVHGTLAGWCDAYCGTSLPTGMTAADVATLPRAPRAAAPAPLAVCVSAWCALPVGVREAVRRHADATKAPGVMRLGVLAPNARARVEALLAAQGLTQIERTATQVVWGTP